MNINDKKYILENLNKEKLITEPFPFFCFDSFFSNTYYEELLRMKPLNEQFQNTDPNRTSNQYAINYRKRFNFIKDMHLLDTQRKNFWTEFIELFTSQEFVKNILLMCEEPILKRYKIDNIKKLKLNIRMELIRDSGGYMISPHTDSPQKILTFLMYIPNDDDNLDLGTSLFKPKNKNFVSEEATQFNFDDFDEIKKMPFKKNFAFGFIKNEKSFHGRLPISKEFKGARDWINYSLQH